MASDKNAIGKPGNIAVLGSTGTIGVQTLEVVRENPGRFRVCTLAANSNIELLIKQIEEFRPELVAVANPEAAEALRSRLPSGIELVSGEEAASTAASHVSVHTVLAAIVGFAGLRPVLAAIDAGKHLALANKESLVAAGPVLKAALAESESQIVPVDSEHSSLFQCLESRRGSAQLRRVAITASGGPFLNMSAEEVFYAPPEEAVKHPRWNMGAKISVDSASLMNKGLEVIEAALLFDLKPAQVEVLVHPQVFLHGFAEFSEGSILAAVYEPDMRVPIAYALGYLRSEDPKNRPGEFPLRSGVSFLDLAKAEDLQFFEPDHARFPALGLCYRALEAGGAMPAVLNAANEAAVEGYLAKELCFGEIPLVVERLMEEGAVKNSPSSLEEVVSLDTWARSRASEQIERLKSQRKLKAGRNG